MENFHVEISEDLKSGDLAFRSNYVVISKEDYKKNFNNWDSYKNDLEQALIYYKNRVKNSRRTLSSNALDDLKKVAISNFITCKSLYAAVNNVSDMSFINKTSNKVFQSVFPLDNKFKV